MHLDALLQKLRQYLIRRRHHIFLAQNRENRTIAPLELFLRRMNRLLDIRVIEPGFPRRKIQRSALARIFNIVRAEALAFARQIVDCGGKCRAAKGTRSVNRSVDQSRGVGDLVKTFNLAFLQHAEICAFGVAGDEDLACGRVGDLRHDFVEAALLVCVIKGVKEVLGDLVGLIDVLLVEVGVYDDVGHGGVVAESWVAESYCFEIDVEDVSVGDEGFGKVRNL